MMTWPAPQVVLALLLALTPAAIIGWALGGALDRHVHQRQPLADSGT